VNLIEEKIRVKNLREKSFLAAIGNSMIALRPLVKVKK